jgi:hypothetical protein
LFLALLLSWPKFSLATLTVSNTGLQGDTNITLDTNGTLGVGTASATAITIGQSSLNVSIPGSLTVSSATTTVNDLHVIGSCLGCGLFSAITAINGLSNATTSLVAGTNITIATSSPNVITISASGGSGSTTPGGSNTQLQFNSSGIFGASPNLTWLSPALTIGQTGTTTGQLKLAGGTSGTITVQASSTAGTWNLTLPTSPGTAGYVLSTDGSGNTSWIAQSGGAQWAATSTGIYYNGGKVGIGTTSPNQLLTVAGTGSFTGNLGLGTNAPSADDSALLIYRAASNPLSNGGSHAVRDESTYIASGTGGYASFDSIPVMSGSLAYSHLSSFQARPQFAGSNTLGALNGFTFNPLLSSGTTTDIYGLNITDATGTGAVINEYGVYINPLTKGTSNYGIYSNGSQPSYFGGVLQSGSDIIPALCTRFDPPAVA